MKSNNNPYSQQAWDFENSKQSSDGRVKNLRSPNERLRPFPNMPSQQFLTLAQSQLELLASCLQHRIANSSSSLPKAKSIALYLPRENVRNGQLEFVPVVLHPNLNLQRVWIAPDVSSNQSPYIPRTLPTLPGFTHASSLLPHYPFASQVQQHGYTTSWQGFEGAAGVGIVEEVTSGAVYSEVRDATPTKSEGNVLSVSLFRGSQTVGVLLVWPSSGMEMPRTRSHRDEVSAYSSYTNKLSSISDAGSSSEPHEIFWSDEDRSQVSRAAFSLSIALSMDMENIPSSNSARNAFAEVRKSPSDSFMHKDPGAVLSGEAQNENYISDSAYQDLLRSQYLQTMGIKDALADNLHQVKNPLQALRTFGKLLQRRLALEEFSSTPYSSDTASLRLLADRMMTQTDRVIDLLQPIETIVDQLEEVSQKNLLALPPSTNYENNPSRSLVLQPARNVNDGSFFNHTNLSESQGMAQLFEPRMRKSENESAELAQNIFIEPVDSKPWTPVIKQDGGMTMPSSNASSISQSSTILGDVDVEMAFVPDVIEPVIAASLAVASERGIDFEIEKINEDELPGVSLCPKSLQEALSNVLENAIKYVVVGKIGNGSTNMAPKIKVSVKPNPLGYARGVNIVVEDNGPGILSTEITKIFERGFRGPRTDSLPGNGIGLDITRSMLARFAATIEAVTPTSETLDGAVIRIMLFRDAH